MTDTDSRIMKRLLKMKATADEKAALEKDGIFLKSPTKQTVLLAALYKKASSGDLNAFREIRAMTGDGKTDTGRVIILDDLPR